MKYGLLLDGFTCPSHGSCKSDEQVIDLKSHAETSGRRAALHVPLASFSESTTTVSICHGDINQWRHLAHAMNSHFGRFPRYWCRNRWRQLPRSYNYLAQHANHFVSSWMMLSNRCFEGQGLVEVISRRSAIITAQETNCFSNNYDIPYGLRSLPSLINFGIACLLTIVCRSL